MKITKIFFSYNIYTFFKFYYTNIQIFFSSFRSYDVIIEKEKLEDYIKEQYKNYEIIKIEEIEETLVLNNAKDYEQNELNDYYNEEALYYFPEEELEPIEGTCTFVATLSMLEYHSRVKKTFKFPRYNDEDIFVNIYNETERNGYISSKSGTNANKHAYILEDAYNLFCKNKQYDFQKSWL